MRVRSAVVIVAAIMAASCAAVLGLPDPTLDDTIPVGGGSSSGSTSSSGSSGGDGSTTTDGGGEDGSTLDGGDGGKGPLTCLKPTTWSNIKLLSPYDQHEYVPSLTDDELTMLWIGADSPSQQSPRFAFYASRGDAAAPFGPRMAATAPNGTPFLFGTCIGPTGAEMFMTGDAVALPIQRFVKIDGGGYQNPIPQNGLDTPYQYEVCRTLLNDAGVMYFHGETPGTPTKAELFRATRNGSDAWGAPTSLGGGLIDGGSGSDNRYPVVRRDELEIFFTRREGNDDQIYTARRASTADPWGAPSKVNELSGSGADAPGWLSPDGCRLYFTATVVDAGIAVSHIFVATRVP